MTTHQNSFTQILFLVSSYLRLYDYKYIVSKAMFFSDL